MRNLPKWKREIIAKLGAMDNSTLFDATLAAVRDDATDVVVNKRITYEAAEAERQLRWRLFFAGWMVKKAW
jgi:hypothetical protein